MDITGRTQEESVSSMEGGWCKLMTWRSTPVFLGREFTGYHHDGWYWTDGNDVEDLGFWAHAYDNSIVSFFAPTIGCSCTDRVCRNGGDALLINIGGDQRFRGNYCDEQIYQTHYFICEAEI